MKYHTYVHTNITKFLEGFRYDAHPMGVLLGVVGALSTFYPDAKDIHDPENRKLQRVRLLAKAPTIAAFAFRHSRGLPFVFPDNDLDYIANFVNMTFSIGGRHKPNKVLQRALEILLILHADHEQNCSTSAVRGVGSSHVDPFSAVSAGIAALYGPLHGGANEAVLAMLDEIGDKKNIPAFIKEVKGGGGRLMGFGHRVYKSYDPRAKLIKRVADDVFRETGLNPKLEIAMELERIALEDEYFIKRKLYPNVDFYSGLIYQAMGYPDRVLHRALRPGPDAGLAGPVGGDAAGQGPEDRPAAADLHRQARSGRSCRSRSGEPMTDQIETLLSERRRFPTTAEFAARAATTAALYTAGYDWKKFWEDQARAIEWMSPWTTTLEWNPPHAKWFVGGKLNVSVNCLDRHLRSPRRNKAAIVWEGEPGERRVLTYWDLSREVGRCANALKRLGVKKGDRVAIYLPMVPEAAVAMLACARIGAVHSVVFGGFSAEALRDRINDARRHRAHHGGRRLPPGPGASAQAHGR